MPSPAPGVACWCASLHVPRDALPEHEALLSLAEFERAARFGTPELRARYVVGRAMLRRVLGTRLGCSPESVPLKRGRRGRPEVEGAYALDFNVTHTRGLALIAVAEHVRVGVDIEHEERSTNADGLSRKFLTERERTALAPYDADARRRRFLRLWTCKEAMSKATGDGLSAPFRTIDIDLEGLRHLGGIREYAPGGWSLHPVAVPHGFLGTVALWAAGLRVASNAT